MITRYLGIFDIKCCVVLDGKSSHHNIVESVLVPAPLDDLQCSLRFRKPTLSLINQCLIMLELAFEQ